MQADQINALNPEPDTQNPADCTISFPAIIKLYADDELMLISNLFTLQNDQHLKSMYFQPQDILIDNKGQVFNIQKTDRINLLKTDQFMPLDEVIKLIQAHLSQHGTVCISKFSAATFQEAFNCLK